MVISGKVGTGKTSIMAVFAGLAENAVFADCDVDAADLHLVLEPDVKQTSDFSGGKRAVTVPEMCVGCGKCQDLCRFGAIHSDSHSAIFLQNGVPFNSRANGEADRMSTIDPVLFEGCRVCVEFCPGYDFAWLNFL